MNHFSLYRLSDGTFTGEGFGCNANEIPHNVPDACGCIVGEFDMLAERVDMATGLVIDYQPPCPSSDHQWDITSKRWLYVMPLAKVKLAAIDTVDSAADSARKAVLSKSTNSEEYKVAEADALLYRLNSFAGTVPEGVASWAYAKRRQGWTDRQAAEDILATADRWKAALYLIRRQRLDVKELVRDATTPAEVAEHLATFSTTLATAMQGVQ